MFAFSQRNGSRRSATDARFPRSCGRARATGALLAFLALALGACASSGDGSGRSGTGPITLDMIETLSSSVADAHDVVSRLRPQWLRSRGATSLRDPQPHYPVVYRDGTRYGPIDALRQIDAHSIREIRYINATEATTRYGTGHMGGAILVASR